MLFNVSGPTWNHSVVYGEVLCGTQCGTRYPCPPLEHRLSVLNCKSSSRSLSRWHVIKPWKYYQRDLKICRGVSVVAFGLVFMTLLTSAEDCSDWDSNDKAGKQVCSLKTKCFIWQMQNAAQGQCEPCNRRYILNYLAGMNDKTSGNGEDHR